MASESDRAATTYAIWGSELSPFALKLRAILDFEGIPYAWLPDDGSRWQNTRAWFAIERGKRNRTIQRYPSLDPLDEYPLVPFLLEGNTTIRYDTSAIARWLDAERETSDRRLFPADDSLEFLAQFLDEAFDEVGLYLVHHNRWVLSATTNDAGARLAREQRRILPPGVGPRFARWFSERQVRRLPYLFSVAPKGFAIPGVSPALVPPSREGFPPTHALLDEIWHDVLDLLDRLLETGPYLLGERFTVADASIYGQLGMNLKDPTANERMLARAPRTHAWLEAIRDRRHRTSGGELAIGPRLRPLIALLGETFVPLMQQNLAAYVREAATGTTRFNEAAFDRGISLYDGVLREQPFRAGIKTFQVRVWRDLCRRWQQLPRETRSKLETLGFAEDWFAGE